MLGLVAELVLLTEVLVCGNVGLLSSISPAYLQKFGQSYKRPSQILVKHSAKPDTNHSTNPTNPTTKYRV